MVTASAFFALLFLGGYHLPLGWLAGPGHVLSPENMTLLGVLASACLHHQGRPAGRLMMVIRWTLPRLRFDQVMMMAWQAIIPIALLAVVVTSVMVYLDLTETLPLLAANILMGGLLLGIYPLLPKYSPNRRVRCTDRDSAPSKAKRSARARRTPWRWRPTPARLCAGHVTPFPRTRQRASLLPRREFGGRGNLEHGGDDVVASLVR